MLATMDDETVTNGVMLKKNDGPFATSDGMIVKNDVVVVTNGEIAGQNDVAAEKDDVTTEMNDAKTVKYDVRHAVAAYEAELEDQSVKPMILPDSQT